MKKLLKIVFFFIFFTTQIYADGVKKMALIIGISDYAPSTKNDLDGIERDTNKMKRLFNSWGFQVTTLYDSQSLKIVDYLDSYAKKLDKNDYFAFYYSGHGSFVPDKNGDEEDSRDETLVLSNGTVNKHLLDDMLYAEFNKIKAKKIIFLDSCHSGTAFRNISNNSGVKAKSISPDDITDIISTPNERGVSLYGSNLKDILSGSDYIVFSAAQDNEESLATPTGSLFTNAVYKTFTNKRYMNRPLNSIKFLLTRHVLKYARKTRSIPHHPNISFSNLETENKSLNSFINLKSIQSNTIKNIKSKSVSYSNSLEDTLNEMIDSGDFKKMYINFDKNIYNVGDSVKFTIDTDGDTGYLTIFYIDGDDVTLLYPNGFISTNRISGKYKFPDDLANGRFELEAYKSCKGCDKEKSVIFALLSSEEIKGIGEIRKGNLITFPKNSKRSNSISRAVRIKIKSQSNSTDLKPQLGKYEFIVK